MKYKGFEIVNEFLSLHKSNKIEDWFKDHNTIYGELIGGVYGELQENEEGVYTIEIPPHQSHNGIPVLFEFEKVEYRPEFMANNRPEFMAAYLNQELPNELVELLK